MKLKIKNYIQNIRKYSIGDTFLSNGNNTYYYKIIKNCNYYSEIEDFPYVLYKHNYFMDESLKRFKNKEGNIYVLRPIEISSDVGSNISIIIADELYISTYLIKYIKN